jgi:porin
MCRHFRIGVGENVLMAVLVTGFGLSGPSVAEDSPYDVELAYTLDVMRVQQGGLKEGNGALSNLDIILTVDTDKAWGLRNGTLFFYALGNDGDDINATHVGSAQGVDNIESDDAVKIYEAWYEHAFENSTLRVGLYDLNSEFDSIDSAGLFINPSHGIGPDYSQSGQNGPSIFPTTSFAIRYAANIGAQGYWQAAALDGVPGDPNDPQGTHIQFNSGDGALLAVEGGVRTENERLRHWAVGAWHYTEPSTENASGNTISSSSNQGLYAFMELGLGNDAACWVRVGMADARINQVASYLGAGLVWTGVAGRADDQAGVAIAIANNSSDFIDATGSEDRETIWELTYRSQISEWFAVQPDIQYVQNPGSDPNIRDALVLGTRFEISF